MSKFIYLINILTFVFHLVEQLGNLVIRNDGSLIWSFTKPKA